MAHSSRSSAANAIVLQNTAPVFVCVLAYLLSRKRPTRPDLVTLLFGTTGILVLFGGAAGTQDLQGVTVGLGSGFMLGVYFVNLRFLRGFDPFALVEPVLNPLWVGEVPSLATLIGGGMILAGLTLRYLPVGFSRTSSST